MTPTPQLIALIREQDRRDLRMLEKLVPDGPMDRDRINQAIAAIYERLERVSA